MKKRAPESAIAIHYIPFLEGLSWQITYQKNALDFPWTEGPVSPRALLTDPRWPQLEALYQRWADDEMTRTGPGAYVLSWDRFLASPESFFTTFGLPRPTAPDIRLKARGAITEPRFHIEALVTLPSYAGNLLQWGRRIGPWLETSRGPVILTGASARLLDRLLAAPSFDIDDRTLFVAEVKQLAKDAGARLDPYLEREEYVLVARVTVDPVLDNETIRLKARYDHPDLPPEALREGTLSRSSTGLGRKRWIARPEARRQFRRLDALPPITGSDVPKFVKNPEAFLPEDIPLDLASFSERVKGLKIRVYRAQPFLHATETERGWFTLDAGVRLESSSDEASVEPVLLPDELLAAIQNAEADASLIRHGNDWIEIPPDARAAVEQLATLRNPSSEPVPQERLPYVLDIFTNLEQVEFNSPFHPWIWTDPHEDVKPPVWFQASLHPYQLDGVRFLWHRASYRWGVLLADEMGLGKTVQVIAWLTILHERNRLRPSLVVAPVSLLANWQEELAKFAPKISWAAHYGPHRSRHIDHLPDADVILTSYDTVSRDQLILGQVDWNAVVLDEAQLIKNVSTGRTEAVKALKNAYRVALTGTPVENSLSDLWSIVDFVQPGLLGSLRSFRQRYETAAKNGPTNLPGDLTRAIAPIYRRRTKQEAGLALPSKTAYRFDVPFGPEQQRRYHEILKAVQSHQLAPLPALRQLQNILGHPLALEGRSAPWDRVPVSSVPKLAKTLEILHTIHERSEKALIFTPSRALQAMLQFWVMRVFNRSPYVINGDVTARQHLVHHFNQAPGFQVMILTPQAGGVGLTLTGANHVIHYSRWWNPAVENQATDRVHRIGQTRPVSVYYPLVVDREPRITADGTVDEILDRLLADKQGLANAVVLPSRNLDVQQELLERAFEPGPPGSTN